MTRFTTKLRTLFRPVSPTAMGTIQASDVSMYIQAQVDKANRIMGLTRRTYTYLDEQIFKFLFQVLVRPYLEYTAAVWSPFKVGEIEKIENVRRRATKQII